MTTVTIDSGVDTLRLDGCTRHQDGAVWGVEGMDGWDGTPAVRESPVARPQADGSLMPSRLTVDQRVLTIRCLVKCSSTLAADALKDRVSDLMARVLTVSVEEPVGVREVTGFLSADPTTTLVFRDQAVRFSLIVTCPDPLKYGRGLHFDGDGSLVRVTNPGRMPAWPTVSVMGRVTALTVSHQGSTVTWQGDSAGLILPFASMIPSCGAVRKDEAFTLPPGDSTCRYTVDEGADVSVTIRPAWR